ncbi:hypothetical protein [Paraburkholderia sp. J94]|uniref:hypothetical protein n=1 Tax=Paraburkholderia sp. J94 TaxID=2805441 RepID=UPI002AB054EE|nr:hypothetical protein [Paraburkholderia sp. J94]
MATPITITEKAPQNAAATRAGKLPGWLWFVLLWCGGVGAAVSLGFVFKVFMNLTLFAVK